MMQCQINRERDPECVKHYTTILSGFHCVVETWKAPEIHSPVLSSRAYPRRAAILAEANATHLPSPLGRGPRSSSLPFSLPRLASPFLPVPTNPSPIFLPSSGYHQRYHQSPSAFPGSRPPSSDSGRSPSRASRPVPERWLLPSRWPWSWSGCPTRGPGDRCRERCRWSSEWP